MTNATVLVTGATGKTGGAVVAQLREKNIAVRAMVRTRDNRSARLERLGAEVVVADMYDYDQLVLAMRGTQRAYYCPPFAPYMIQGANAFAVAAKDTNLESIVSLSQWLAGPSHPALMSRQHWLVDHIFGMVPDIAYTILRPGFFASYPYLELLPFAAHLGVYPMPVSGEATDAPPSNEDIARIAVAALIDPAKHAGKTYRPTSPELLSVSQMVSIMGRVLNRKVRHVPVPMWMFYKAARMQGAPEILLSGLRYYSQDLAAGSFAFGAPTDDVLETTGQQAETFESIVRRYAALPNAKQSLASSLGAFARFMMIPFRKGFDPHHYERDHQQPKPPAPHLAITDERWKQSRVPNYAQTVSRDHQSERNIDLTRFAMPEQYQRISAGPEGGGPA